MSVAAQAIVRALAGAIAVAIALAGGAAIAAKPPPAEGKAAAEDKQSRFFSERHWTATREFYNEQIRAGVCPLGFAPQDGGCKPPDQARKWALGKPLPPGAIRFDLPQALAAKLGKPPAGYRYVRVMADILLVSNKTKLVVDAILDLGRR